VAVAIKYCSSGHAVHPFIPQLLTPPQRLEDPQEWKSRANVGMKTMRELTTTDIKLSAEQTNKRRRDVQVLQSDY
jgi:hypothetical protein